MSLIFSLLMFLSLLILIISLIIGVVVIIYRAIRNPNVQHFEKNTKKIAISTGSGFASSFIASMIGSGEGITVFLHALVELYLLQYHFLDHSLCGESVTHLSFFVSIL